MFLRRAAKLYPNKIAVVCGMERFTYQQFNKRVHQVSQLLSSLDIKPGTVVATSVAIVTDF